MYKYNKLLDDKSGKDHYSYIAQGVVEGEGVALGRRRCERIVMESVGGFEVVVVVERIGCTTKMTKITY